MPGTAPLLDMVASLASLYALVSLLLWTAMEGLAQVTGSRRRVLVRSLERICGGAEDADAARELVGKILQHPVLGSAAGAQPESRSDIAPTLFAAALVDVLARRTGEPHPRPDILIEAAPTRHLRDALTVLGRGGGDGLVSLEARIADWYAEQARSRLTSAPRRVAVSIAMGLVIAIAFDVDALSIARAAWSASVAPGSLAVLPLGWGQADGLAVSPATLLLKALGFAISAVALSAGVRFWETVTRSAVIQRMMRYHGRRPAPATPLPATTLGATLGVATLPAATLGVALPAEGAYEASNLTRDDIIDIQRALGLRGRFVTGVIDIQTRALVEDFQLSVGRRPTGVLTPYLVERLLAQSAR